MKSFISAIGTSNPAHCFSQMGIVDFMARGAGMNDLEKKKLTVLYKASGIKRRYSVLPDFGARQEEQIFFPPTTDMEPFPGVRERMLLYEKQALPLALMAIRDCFLHHTWLSPLQITHLITVSCTGMYAPGLDLDILNALNLPGTINRTCVNYMGCYAAFNALKVADVICRAEQDAKVLIVSVELCTIHYQKKKDWDTLLSNALFSDGAAAVVVESKPTNKTALGLQEFHCDINRAGKSEMAWHISDFGFEMTLSSYVPDLIRDGIGKLTDKLLRKLSLQLEDIDLFAIHPGGKRILEVIEEELNIPREKNINSHKVLADYGNMSSATIFFVLKEILTRLEKKDQGKKILSFAFGPGLTIESMVLDVHIAGENTNTSSQLNNADYVSTSII